MFSMFTEGTAFDDLGKTLVKCGGKDSTAERFVQTFGYVQMLWIQNGTGVRTPPENGLVVSVPGKYAFAVGAEESLTGKITAHSQQTIP